MIAGRRAALAVAAVLTATWLAGCVRLPPTVQETAGFAAPDTAYGRAVRRFTRHVELYQGFDTVAIAWATWKTPELRRVLADASIRAFQLKGAQAEALRQEEERASRSGREFHLSVYTPKKQWNDLEDPSTLWRLVLELPDGTRLAALKVVYREKTDKIAVEYPYASPWTREYSVLFPLLDEKVPQGRGTLVMTGPLGTARFEF